MPEELTPLRISTALITSAAVGAVIAAVSLPTRAETKDFTVIRIDAAAQGLTLFLNDERGEPFHSFNTLNAWLRTQDRQLAFAMNAGMFHPDFKPVGLLIAEGAQHSPLNLEDGEGNFFLKPNGVFFVTDEGPVVLESSEYAKAAPANVKLATQSGPLLVQRGEIHPAFAVDSTSRYVRNGVGVRENAAYFVITEKPVTFHELAVFFRDELNCQDALYLDGAISSLFMPDLQRNDALVKLGPIIAVTRELAAEEIQP